MKKLKIYFDMDGVLANFDKAVNEMRHLDEVPWIHIPNFFRDLEPIGQPNITIAELQNKGYGGLPSEIGYCNGHNKKLNGLEYHRNSEINVAVTDLVLLIGHQQDIEKDFTYDTSKVEAFLVPAGTGIEVYATTLHYAPCHVNEAGFQCVVVLPKGTNTELTFDTAAEGEDKLLTAKNKWLIAHEEAAIEGAFNGLKGENVGID